MASEPPVVTETRNVSVRQVSNGYIISGTVLTTTVTPPATSGFSSQTSTEIVADTVAAAVDAVTAFINGGPLTDPTP